LHNKIKYTRVSWHLARSSTAILTSQDTDTHFINARAQQHIVSRAILALLEKISLIINIEINYSNLFFPTTTESMTDILELLDS
jgi:hypothetical protein